MNIRLTSALLLSLAVSACGGGGGGDGPAEPVASKDAFPVAQAYGNALAARPVLNLRGTDNSVVPIVERVVTYSDGSTKVFREPIPGYRNWRGQVSLSRRAPSDQFKASTRSCASATTVVDIALTLTRQRDGYIAREAISIGYEDNFKPVCALVLDGNYWTWNLSEPLPATPVTLSGLSGVEFTGVVSRTPFPTDTDSFLTSMVTLEPDTSSTAFLSFLYNLPDPSEPFAMFGRTANFKFRIDSLGNFLGFRYVRTGVLSDSSDLVTLSFTSEY